MNVGVGETTLVLMGVDVVVVGDGNDQYNGR